MDSRKPPDTNVVRSLRSGDLSDEERRRLASTIFAEQDEVGTFSRGNLVPPASVAPPTGEDPSAIDPFFEELETTSPRDQTRTRAVAGERDATAAYFEALGSQTPAEMSQGITPQTPAAAMPGSANLPGEVPTQRHRRLHRRFNSRPSSRRSLPIPRIHVAAHALLGAFGALVVAGVALAAIVGGGGHGAHAASQLATRKASAPSSHNASPAIPPLLVAARSRSSFRHRAAPRRATLIGRRHRGARRHASAAADAPAAPAARAVGTDSGATTNAATAVILRSSTGSSASGSQATPATPSTSSSNATSAASAATQSQHAGPTGPAAILGPGHCNC